MTISKDCDNCGPGTVSTYGKAKCTECQAGYHSNDKHIECLACVAGLYSDQDLQSSNSSCKKCPRGTYSSAKGVHSKNGCNKCSPGHYGTEPAATSADSGCHVCLEGQFQPLAGATSCDLCPTGYGNEVTASTGCLGVPPGSFVNSSDATMPCQVGYTCAGGNAPPMPCEIGTYAASEGSVRCVECAPGKYQDQPGQGSCKPCEINTKSEEPASKKCDVCPDGEDATKSGNQACQQCALGKYKNDALSECTTCPAGQYQDTRGQDQCKTCSSNDERPNSLKTSCELPPWGTCKAGVEYLNDVSVNRMEWKCSKCPKPGGDCTENSGLESVRPLHDFWNVTWSPFWERGKKSSSSSSPFHPCPYKDHCINTKNATCAPGVDPKSVLCALCLPGYVRREGCVECSSQSVGTGVYIFIGIFVLLMILVFLNREKIRRLRRKYGSLWRDVVRVLTINVSFMQISSSLPSIMKNITWPASYLNFLSRLDFLNLDLMNFFALPCVNDALDYRFNVLVALFVPLAILLLALLLFVVRKRQIRTLAEIIAKDSQLRSGSAEYLFDTLDGDESGSIELSEFQNLMSFVGKRVNANEATELMNVVKASVSTTKSGSGGNGGSADQDQNELSRDDFVAVVVSGDLERITKIGTTWVVAVELERAKTSYQAAVLVVLLLVHAPISQRFFYYFAFDNVQGKKYLQADYSFQYDGEDWQAFLPVVVLLGMCFVAALPLTIGALLWWNRHHLNSPHTKRKLGFLYRPFAQGAEFWELHEVLRKLLLMGVLIYFPSNVRAAAAVLICVVAVATLNFVQPHKNRVVFWVAEMAFLLTCFKYLSAIFVVTQETGELTKEDNKVLGALLIVIDVAMMTGSIFSMLAIVVVLRKATKGLKKEKQNETKSIEIKTELSNDQSQHTAVVVVPVTSLAAEEEMKETKEDSEEATAAAGYEKEAVAIRRRSEVARLHTLKKQKAREIAADARVQKRLELRSRAKRVGALERCPLFASVASESRDRIVDTMKYEKFVTGTVVCEEGREADSMYLLMKGACSITVQGNEVATMQELAVFGESALFGKGAKRNATVTAAINVEVLVLSREALERVIASGDLDEHSVSELKRVGLERMAQTMELGQKKGVEEERGRRWSNGPLM